MFYCLACAKQYQGGSRWVGRQVKCTCGSMFEISVGLFDFDPRVIAEIYDAAKKTTNNGGSVRDFRQALAVRPAISGFDSSDPWRSTLAFYSVFGVAYAVRTVRGLIDAELSYWQFKTFGKVCYICGRLSDKIFAIDDRKYFPPIILGCECYVDPVFNKETKGRRIASSSKLIMAEYEWATSAGLTVDHSVTRPVSLDMRQRDIAMQWLSLARNLGWFVPEEYRGCDG